MRVEYGLRPVIMALAGILAACSLLGNPAVVDSARAQDQVPQEVKVKYSLFYEYYKNKDFKSASPYLSWLLENAPTFRGTRNWERGINMYESIAENVEDEAVTKTYLDSALALYDRIFPTFAEHEAEIDSASWILNRGRFLQTHSNVYTDRQDEVLNAYMKAFNMNPTELNPYYVRYITDRYVSAEKKDSALAFMKRAESVFENNSELLSYFDDVRNELFTNPKERIAFLEQQLEENPEDVQILEEMIDLYRGQNNMQQVEQLGQRLVEIQPSVETYMDLAEIKHQQSQYEAAMERYQQALEMAESSEERRDINYEMAQIQQEQGNLPQARTYARRALDHDSEFGEAYMLIGDLYARAVQNSDTMDREDRAVYWLVLDYYERAKQVDPSIATQANNSIQTYRKYIPSKEDLFFKDWEQGQEYTIDYEPYSWINETTEVRVPS